MKSLIKKKGILVKKKSFLVMILVYLTYILFKKHFILFVIAALDLIVYLLFDQFSGSKRRNAFCCTCAKTT